MPDRRSAAASAVLAGLLVLGPAATAHAHGDTIALTVTGSTGGHPQATALWENDRDPVEERIAGTFSATAPDGTALGPWRLVAVPGRPASSPRPRCCRPATGPSPPRPPSPDSAATREPWTCR
ncbi:hypothetical protein ACFQ1I_12415 [Kitasatospora arboriphila]